VLVMRTTAPVGDCFSLRPIRNPAVASGASAGEATREFICRMTGSRFKSPVAAVCARRIAAAPEARTAVIDRRYSAQPTFETGL